jgi:hypothetical protein
VRAVIPLRFLPYGESVDRPNVVVDGSPNAGTVLTLSHWPGQPCPAGCEADTSAQMVFRYLALGADRHGDAAVVTNNHFDQDGLCGVYALTDPDAALRQRERIEDVAAAGDFAVYAERDAARLSMAITALADPRRSPLGDLPTDYGEACGVLYRAALERLPAWLDDPAGCRTLWAEEDAALDAGLAAIASGAVAIAEDPAVDLAVVTLPGDGWSAGSRFTSRTFDGVHPMALHRATERSVILTVDPGGGRHRLTCRYEGWVQFRSRTIRSRVDLRPLAERLAAAEPGGARWSATGPGDLTPELHVDDGPASSLDPGTLTQAVTEHLATAPPAWDPFAPTPA